jgi:hypothetical protein
MKEDRYKILMKLADQYYQGNRSAAINDAVMSQWKLYGCGKAIAEKRMVATAAKEIVRMGNDGI